MNRRAIAVALMCTALGATTAACGNDHDATPATSAPAASPTVPTTTPAAPAPPLLSNQVACAKMGELVKAAVGSSTDGPNPTIAVSLAGALERLTLLSVDPARSVMSKVAGALRSAAANKDQGALQAAADEALAKATSDCR